MKFDYDNFIKSLQKEFDDVFTAAEIKEILDLDTELTMDTPLSTGKRLEINYVAFSGRKITDEQQEYSNQEIDYTQEIYSGVNMWVADNLKGKSSIFKIIKFALTGQDSLKSNISKWIKHILLVFSINEKKYTVYINREKKSIQAALFNKEFRTYPNESEHEQEKLFSSTSKEDFQSQLQDFFFHQFDYYSLRWTQKSSVKDNDDLLEAGASWQTYFKSIFLESKDSGDLMYGAQGTKVFQMLLGLHLTSPINKLSVARDKMQHLKGKQQSYASRETVDIDTKKSELGTELAGLNEKYSKLVIAENQSLNTAPLLLEYDSLVKTVATESTRIMTLNSSIQTARNEKIRVEGRKQFVDEEVKRLRKEFLRVEKQRTDIKEYLEIGVFFSNLDVKTCPSCSHTVTKEKKQNAAHTHQCALCRDDISNDEHEVDTANLTAKLEGLVIVQENFKRGIKEFEKEFEELREKSNALYGDIIKLEQEHGGLQDSVVMNERLEELQKTIAEERKKIRPRDSERNDLIEKKAVVTFRIKQLNESPEKIGDPKVEQKIKLLIKAISELNRIRYEDGQSVLKKLADLMTNEVQALGLKISEIRINDRFDIKYKQDGDFLSFSEIAEGEQLRAKLAFYLSLIQLDIEHNYGRHSRLLIIDSPGKEEGDKNYLEGLSTLIKEIESRFGDKLQILIGTAERSLENTVTRQNVFPAQTFIF
ncbi:P-loop NTPase family protein [Algoriphagus antarcticus]|uniref:AAA domain-containing protein n=1 Tax=Algoriphagus antarcticus TaxID=238540 RepID=A0A3E0DX85_9BACT|nr:hypothetical protein [Algoriphagus antarcticus]REG90581.1 hypothetical protein C8N25_10679 [Algoriphagus antarcticus]